MCVAAHLFAAPQRPDLSAILPEVRVALADLGIVTEDGDCHTGAWRSATHGLSFEGGAAHAAQTLRAFDAIVAINIPARLGRLEVGDVVRVLDGVGRAMRFWTWEDKARTSTSPQVRWNIENEYHVQNLLWAVLAPLFPDLRAEEYASPVGQKNPRMDLTIPSLHLVVEVKFVRAGKRFADIIEEIAADASLYGADPEWRTLLPFVWDDSARTEEHADLVDGLRRLDMVYDAVIMARPGKMLREDRATGRSTSKSPSANRPPR